MAEHDLPAARHKFDRCMKNCRRAFLPNPHHKSRLHRGKSHEIVCIRSLWPPPLHEGRGDSCRAAKGWPARTRTFFPSNEETGGWAPEDLLRSFPVELDLWRSQFGKSGRGTG